MLVYRGTELDVAFETPDHRTFRSFAKFLNPIDQLLQVESVLLFAKISLFCRQCIYHFLFCIYTLRSLMGIRGNIKFPDCGLPLQPKDLCAE